MRSSLLPLAAAALLGGCTAQRFDRFMEHPILSWVQPEPPPAPTRAAYPNRACYQTARSRTVYLDPAQFSDATVRRLFTQIYDECVAQAAR